MAVRNIQYYFGRFNLIAVYDNKREFVLRGLQGGNNVQARGSVWGFFEVEEIADEGEAYIYGYLVKYRPEGEEEIVVRETQQIEDEAVRNRVVAKSRFFLHVQSGMIAYHPISKQIDKEQFRSHFASVFEENHERFFVTAEVQSIEQDLEIFDMIRRFQHIQEISISLHPSNPNNRDLWERTDKRIKALNAANYQEKIEANPRSEGLKIEQDEETTAKIHMAVDGYGKALIRGTLDNKATVVSTNDNPITAPAPSDEAPPADIFSVLVLTFKVIKSRFTHEDEQPASKREDEKPVVIHDDNKSN